MKRGFDWKRRLKRRFSAGVKDIIAESGDIGAEYAENIENSLARGDEETAEKYGGDLARFLKNALLNFRISSVEYDRAKEELELMVVTGYENE